MREMDQRGIEFLAGTALIAAGNVEHRRDTIAYETAPPVLLADRPINAELYADLTCEVAGWVIAVQALVRFVVDNWNKP